MIKSIKIYGELDKTKKVFYRLNIIKSEQDYYGNLEIKVELPMQIITNLVNNKKLKGKNV